MCRTRPNLADEFASAESDLPTGPLLFMLRLLSRASHGACKMASGWSPRTKSTTDLLVRMRCVGRQCSARVSFAEFRTTGSRTLGIRTLQIDLSSGARQKSCHGVALPLALRLLTNLLRCAADIARQLLLLLCRWVCTRA